MTYNPNADQLTISNEVVVDDIHKVLLAEFAEGSPIREVLFDVEENPEDDQLEAIPTRPLMQAHGVRLHRVIRFLGDGRHEVVTEYNPQQEVTSMEFLAEGGVVVATATPGPKYTWSLAALSKCNEDKRYSSVLGVRQATDEEAAELNLMYPNWLSASQKFDEAEAIKNMGDTIEKMRLKSALQ